MINRLPNAKATMRPPGKQAGASATRMPATVAEHEITERAAKSTLESTALEPTTVEPSLEPTVEPTTLEPTTLESTALEPSLEPTLESTALEPSLEPAAEPFGSFVRAKRLAANISLKDFAKRLEVSPAYWSCVETNKEKPPVSDLIARAAQALGEHPDAYFIRARRLPPDMADPQALATVIRYYRRRFKPR